MSCHSWMSELCQLRERAKGLLDEGQSGFSLVLEHQQSRCHLHTSMQNLVPKLGILFSKRLIPVFDKAFSAFNSAAKAWPSRGFQHHCCSAAVPTILQLAPEKKSC